MLKCSFNFIRTFLSEVLREIEVIKLNSRKINHKDIWFWQCWILRWNFLILLSKYLWKALTEAFPRHKGTVCVNHLPHVSFQDSIPVQPLCIFFYILATVHSSVALWMYLPGNPLPKSATKFERPQKSSFGWVCSNELLVICCEAVSTSASSIFYLNYHGLFIWNFNPMERIFEKGWGLPVCPWFPA